MKKLMAVSGRMANMTRPRTHYIEILWRMLIRCNYDCSYCSAAYHDNTSDIPTVEFLIEQSNKLHQYATNINKQIYYDFTGGEPFIVKDLPEFLKHLKSLSTTAQCSIASNTSAPLKIYHRVMSNNYVYDLNLSIHFENLHSSVAEKVEKIISLTREYGPNRVKAILMLEAGQLDIVQQAGNVLKLAGANVIYKVVNPQIKPNIIHVVRPGEKANIHGLYDSKKVLLSNFDYYMEQYYSKEELEFVRSNVNFQTDDKDVISIWDDGTVEYAHSTELINGAITESKGWTCYAGLNSLHIRPDGETTIALCNQANIGNLYDDTIVWPTTPVVCEQERCTHHTDLRIPKFIK